MSRRIKKRHPAITQTEGEGATVHRTLGTQFLTTVDPFLLLDEFELKAETASPGFANHPHRGFETITYLFEGVMSHKDSIGVTGSIKAGGIQRMTAGRGIIHSETPSYEDGDVRGLQLWVNLAAKDKMQDPAYHDIQAEDVPVKETEEVLIRVLSGEVDGVKGPLDPGAVDLVYFDITFKETSLVRIPLPTGHAAMLYVVKDLTGIGSRTAQERELAELSLDGAEFADVQGRKGSRAVLIAGKPLNEPVERYGPFVMNTVQQLEEAVQDYKAGKFGSVE